MAIAALSAPALALAEPAQTGPQTPKVVWVHKSEEQFIARPVIGAKELYVSGLGKLNSGSFRALAIEADAAAARALVEDRPVLEVAGRQCAGGRWRCGDLWRRHASDRWSDPPRRGRRHRPHGVELSDSGDARAHGRNAGRREAAWSTWARAMPE